MVNAVYNEKNFKILLFYIIIPLTILLLVFFIGTKIYEKLRKNKDINHTNYVINYWNSFIGVFIASVLLSVSIGYGVAFTKLVNDYNALDDNIFFYYFFMAFPIIPLIFLIIYIRKFIHNLKAQDKIEEGVGYNEREE